MTDLWKYIDVNADPDDIERAVNEVADGTTRVKFVEDGKPVGVMISVEDYENIRKQIKILTTQVNRSRR